jgi:hypothetical protein
MKNICTIILTALTLSLTAQDYSELAKVYFSKYLDSKSFSELTSMSLPTFEECKLVFKGQNAKIYFDYIDEMRIKMEDELKKRTFEDELKIELETFADIRIESFCTADILQGKGNYAGGMKKLADKLQKNVTFYEINLLRTVEAEHGVAFKYWVNINGRWVAFPKPWRAFTN